MNDSQKEIMDFWYEFDEYFYFGRPSEIDQAEQSVDAYGNLISRFYYHQEKGTIDVSFKKEFETIKDSVKLLADNIRTIMDRHFKGNAEIEQTAFELFSRITF